MSKLYVFGIGGTGSRVLKSLTMLLASGAEIDADEIVPVIIDPDVSSGNLTETVDLMRRYNRIRERLSFSDASRNRFFKTAINLDVFQGGSPAIQLNTANKTFEDYIGCPSMDEANKALMYMLFSQNNLHSDMEVGFKGNPNIGSVVLNQFENLDSYRNVIGSMAQDDRIFVISSIFGGTGASGFPLLVKNMRGNSNLPGFNIAKNAPIGAITIMPYFTLAQDDDSAIDSTTFISKTRSALKYYENGLKETNVLYYIGDTITSQYDNHEGGAEQLNRAHFIEFASALAVMDFMSIDAADLSVNNGVVQNQIYKEYGFADDVDDGKKLIFENLCELDDVKKSLSQFTLLYKFLTDEFRTSRDQRQPWVNNFGIDENFVKSSFYKEDLKKFMSEYARWLEEMAGNKRAFAPFNLTVGRDTLFNYVTGVSPSRVFSLHSNYALVEDWLNGERPRRGMKKEQDFMELFYEVTEKAVRNKLKM